LTDRDKRIFASALVACLAASQAIFTLDGRCAEPAKAGAKATSNVASGAASSAAAKAAPAANSSLAQGYKLYQEKRYADASTALWKAIQKEGAGASAYLYMAHCQYALGHLKQAIPYYRYVKDNFPRTQEGALAAQYLTRLDPASTAAAASPPSSTSDSAASAAPSGGGSDDIPAGMTGNLLDRIELVRPVMGHPELSKLTISTIRDDLEKLPRAVKKILVKGGIKFCITTSLVDKYPETAYKEGRGYDGHSLKRCPGMFNGHDTVVICERVIDEGSNEIESPITASKMTETFYHEIGHALDACLCHYSMKDDYRHNYYLDIARIPPDAAGRLAYFMQKSIAGQQESCGEITAVALGSGERHAEDIRTYFPLTLAFVKNKLNIDQMLKEEDSAKR